MRTPDAVSDDGSGRCEWGHQVAMVKVEMGTQGLSFEVGKRPAGRFAKLRLVNANPGTKPTFCLCMLLTISGRVGATLDLRTSDCSICRDLPRRALSLEGSPCFLGAQRNALLAEAQNQCRPLQVASDLSSPLAFVASNPEACTNRQKWSRQLTGVR
jgi:hypothetical protein